MARLLGRLALLIPAALTGLIGLTALPAEAVEVGVSIQLSQPGAYGRIDIGHYPNPVLVQTHPVLLRPAPRRVEPVYLWVPRGHRKHWRKHCHHYGACSTPVYFVEEAWGQRHLQYAEPRHPGKGRGHRHGHGGHR